MPVGSGAQTATRRSSRRRLVEVCRCDPNGAVVLDYASVVLDAGEVFERGAVSLKAIHVAARRGWGASISSRVSRVTRIGTAASPSIIGKRTPSRSSTPGTSVAASGMAILISRRANTLAALVPRAGLPPYFPNRSAARQRGDATQGRNVPAPVPDPGTTPATPPRDSTQPIAGEPLRCRWPTSARLGGAQVTLAGATWG